MSSDCYPAMFKKERGTGGIKGEELEFQYVALMFLRCINTRQRIHRFRLATNFAATDNFEGHNFQDVGIQIFTNSEPVESDSACAVETKQKLFFMQLKYKENLYLTLDTLLHNNAFSLAKYYNWFLKLKNRTENGINVFPESKFEDIIFAIFTTADRKNLKEMSINGMIDWHSDEILHAGREGDDAAAGQHYFTFNKIAWGLVTCTFSGTDEMQKQDFMSRLRIYPAQAKNLMKLIKKELAEAYGMSPSEVEVSHLRFVNLIEKWWKNERKAPFLSEKDKDSFLENSRSSNVSWSLDDYTNRVLNDMNSYNVEFERNDQLRTVISENHVINVTTNAGNTKLALINIVQVLEEMQYDKDFLITKLSMVRQEKKTLQTAWHATGRRALVIVCEHCTEHAFMELLPLLSHETSSPLLGEVPHKVIFIDLPHEEFEIIKIGTYQGVDFGEVTLTISLVSLKKSSQETILNKTINVSYDDKKTSAIKLKDLRASDLNKIKDKLNVEVLWLLIQNLTLETFSSMGSAAGIELRQLYACQENDPTRGMLPVLANAQTIVGQITDACYTEVEAMVRFANNPATSQRDAPVYAFGIVRRIMGPQLFDSTMEELKNEIGQMSVVDFTKKIMDKLGGD